MTKKVTFNVDFPENLKKDASLSSTPRLAYDDLGDFIEERSKIRRLLDNSNETELKVDYSDFSNHVFFDSAVSKYLVAQDRILTKYPYNGNKEEKDAYFLTGSGYENYLFEQWPRYVGYVEFSSSAQFISASDFNKKLVFNTSSLMMSADVNTRQQSGLQNMVCAVSSTQASYLLYFSGTGPSLVSRINSGSTVATVSVDYSQYIDTWRNVASIVDRDRGLISLYIDGNKVASQSFTPGPMEQANITVYVGGNTTAGYSAYSGSLDNVRLYFTASELLLQKNLGKQLDAENYVALNYTFSEGKTFTSSVDVNVIDYSKNALHGLIVGYSSNVRVSGTSRFNDSGSPILYSFHGAVTEFSSSAILSATLYDNNNNNQIFNLLPEGVLIADEQQEGLMAAFSLALARYFDEIKLYIDQFENLRITNYDNIDETPDQFLPFLTRYFGWKVTEHFNDADPLSFFFGEGVKTNQQLDLPLVAIRNQFWRRILNNLPYLLKTKGKRYNLDAFFNVIGVNKENINLKEYGYLSEGSLEDTRIHKEKVSAFVGIGTGSLSSSFVRAPSVVSASNNSYTIEAWMQLPYFSSSYASRLSVLTGSVWQMADSGVTSGSYALLWNVLSLGNTQGKFILTGSDGQLFSSSNVEVFDGDFVYVAAGLNPDRTPFISVRTLDNDELDLQADFSGTTALSGVFTGSKFDFIMGATSGTYFQKQTQGYYGQYKVWARTLSASEITTHAFDFENVGVMDPTERPNPLRGYWPLTENISASAGGILNGIQDLSRNDRVATGSNFPVSYNPYKKFLVEYNTLSPSFDLRWTENKIRVRNKSELTIDDVAHDTNEVSLEFNLVDSLNKDISKIFATFDLFNNAIGNPINKYRDEYADLEAYRRVYFERLGDSLHFNQFFGLFKWFDKKISDAIKQLLPARVRFIGGEQVVESHALERPRYQYKYPIFRTPVDLPNIDISGALKLDSHAMESYEPALPAMGTTARTRFDREKVNSLKNRVPVSPRYSSAYATATTPFAKKDVKSVFDQGSSFLGSKDASVNTTTNQYTFFSSSIPIVTIDQMPRALSINNIAVSPEAQYYGRQANTSIWVPASFSSSLLQITGSGAPVVPSQGTPFLSASVGDFSVRFSGSNTGATVDGAVGQCFAAIGSSSLADMTTEDFVLEAVFSYQESVGFGGSTKAIVVKGNPAIFNGFYLNQNAWDGTSPSRDITFLIGDNGTNVAGTTYNGKPHVKAWYHVMVFVDRSEVVTNGLRMFVNGQEVEGQTNIAGNFQSMGSISNALPLSIGGYPDAQKVHHGNIALISLWKNSNWFAGGTQNITDWRKIANDRFARLVNVRPNSLITAYGQPDRTVVMSASRETPAYLTKFVNNTGSLVLVGQNWPRISQQMDVSGNINTGYLAEGDATNILSASDVTGSYVFSTANNSRFIFSGTTFGGLPVFAMVVTSSIAAASPRIDLTSSLSSTLGQGLLFSVYVKSANPLIQTIGIGTDANGANWNYYNLISGTWIASGSISNPGGGIESLGDGWYRVTSKRPNSLSTGAALRPALMFSTASDFGISTTNPGNLPTQLTCAYIYGPQLEIGRLTPSSLTYSSSSFGSGSRMKDSLYFTASAPLFINRFSVKEFTTGSTTLAPLGNKNIFNALSVNGQNRATMFINATGRLTYQVAISGATTINYIGPTAPNMYDSKATDTVSVVVNQNNAHQLTFNSNTIIFSGVSQVPGAQFFDIASGSSFDGLISDLRFAQDIANVNAFFPVQVNGDSNVDQFVSNVDMNSRNESARASLARQEQNTLTDVGNGFARRDYGSSANNSHYFFGGVKHVNLKLVGMSSSGQLYTTSSDVVPLAGGNMIELSCALMDFNNITFLRPVRTGPGVNGPPVQTINLSQIFGYASSSGHDLIDAKIKFSVSSSIGAFSAGDIGVEFRDVSSSDWFNYQRIERLGTFLTSSVDGWLDFEYSFTKGGRVASPRMSYFNTPNTSGPAHTTFRLSSSAGKSYVFRSVRVEFKEALTDAGVTYYRDLDNQNNEKQFTYMNENVMHDVDG